MFYYKSKYLAKKTGINPARWKRWVREFLPPDPLGGLQSGYARQFNLKDAFKVHLGGYLVHSLKFSVSEAKTVLSDLNGWLNQNGFFKLTAANSVEHRVVYQINHRIYIFRIDNGEFGYTIRSIATPDGDHDDEERLERYRMTFLKTSCDLLESGKFLSARVLNIGYLYNAFIEQIAANQGQTPQSDT
jgi:hypothetical protein